MNQNFAPEGQEATTESEQPEEELNQQTAQEDQSSTMEELLDDNGLGFDFPSQGDIRKGTVARVSETEILVSIGTKSEGVIPSREVDQIDPELREELIVGNEITVYVVNPEDQNGNVLLSFVRALEEKDWLFAESLLASGEALEGKIVGFNKGGLIVPVGQLRGFVPASQVSLLRRIDSSGNTPEQRWGSMVDEPITVSVIEVDRERRRLILSERVALQETRESLKERLLDELSDGDVRTGRVTSLADFGAFVNIDGADGLVHLSEISWERIEHPREVLKVGQEVEVKVIGVDRDRKRIGLSIRQLQEDPWVKNVENLKEGQLIEGTITHLTKFGAFARLDEDLEGLIHISEISEERVAHPKEVLHEGDVVTLRVIKIEPERHRIGLSLRKVDSPAYTDFDWKMTLAEVVEESHSEEGEVAVVEEESASEEAEAVVAETETEEQVEPAEAEEDAEEGEAEAVAEEIEAAEEDEPAEAEVAVEEIEVEEQEEPAEAKAVEEIEVEEQDEPAEEEAAVEEAEAAEMDEPAEAAVEEIEIEEQDEPVEVEVGVEEIEAVEEDGPVEAEAGVEEIEAVEEDEPVEAEAAVEEIEVEEQDEPVEAEAAVEEIEIEEQVEPAEAEDSVEEIQEEELEPAELQDVLVENVVEAEIEAGEPPEDNENLAASGSED
jgi:small subunit ribosomal protein S1